MNRRQSPAGEPRSIPAICGAVSGPNSYSNKWKKESQKKGRRAWMKEPQISLIRRGNMCPGGRPIESDYRPKRPVFSVEFTELTAYKVN